MRILLRFEGQHNHSMVTNEIPVRITLRVRSAPEAGLLGRPPAVFSPAPILRNLGDSSDPFDPRNRGMSIKCLRRVSQLSPTTFCVLRHPLSPLSRLRNNNQELRTDSKVTRWFSARLCLEVLISVRLEIFV
jgi:hypothetical protein